MRNWSIISDNVRYIQHHQATSQNLNIDTLDYRDHKELYLKLKEEEWETLDVDFGLYPDITKSRYLNAYEGIYAEIVYAKKFNENSDLSTTYLGQTESDEGHLDQSWGKISHHRSRVCFRKIIRWHGMSNSVRYRCYTVIHVKILLLEVQDSTFTT